MTTTTKRARYFRIYTVDDRGRVTDTDIVLREPGHLAFLRRYNTTIEETGSRAIAKRVRFK